MNEREIFHAAIASTDPVERMAYIAKVCAGDDSLMRHVEAMLQVYPELGTFLESPAVDWDADRPGDLLATGSRSGSIDLWDVKTGVRVRQLHGHIGLISAMVLSGDGRTLATASCDGSVKLWDGGTGRELRTLHRSLGWMYGVAFSPDGNTLATGGEDGLLRLWEASSTEAVAADLRELEVPNRR